MKVVASLRGFLPLRASRRRTLVRETGRARPVRNAVFEAAHTQGLN